MRVFDAGRLTSDGAGSILKTAQLVPLVFPKFVSLRPCAAESLCPSVFAITRSKAPDRCLTIPEAWLPVVEQAFIGRFSAGQAVIHPKIRERELLRNGTSGAIFFPRSDALPANKHLPTGARLVFLVAMSLDSPYLPAVGLVATLEKEDRDALGSYGTFHLAQPGKVVIEQGKPHGKLFFIIEGLLHARRNDEGNDILLGRVQPGEWMGEVDLFDPSAAVCSVVAIEPTQYWVITRDDLEAFINNYPHAGTILLIGLATTLGRRIRELTRKLAEQSELAQLRESLYRHTELPPES